MGMKDYYFSQKQFDRIQGKEKDKNGYYIYGYMYNYIHGESKYNIYINGIPYTTKTECGVGHGTLFDDIVFLGAFDEKGETRERID